ncbi:MAG: hypothetical protein IJ168_02020 [Eubacterium sp.]|nr:hypothetical protein [Eubacterium sp.]
MSNEVFIALCEERPALAADMIEDEMIESGFKLDEETSERMFNNIMQRIQKEGEPPCLI